MSIQNVVYANQPKRRFTVFSNAAPYSPSNRDKKSLRILEIGQTLATQLDVKWVVDSFFGQIEAEVPRDSFSFTNAELAIAYSVGVESRHRLHYRLVLADHVLGEIELTRARLFSTREIKLLEDFLCALLYPLRNAILYQNALRSAHRDPLTAVQNRAAMESSLPREVQLAQRHATPMTLMVVDLDNFKEVNDSHGHPVGDDALRQLVKVFSHCLRGTDLVFRYGGDEFVIALNNTDIDAAAQVAERIREQIQQTPLKRGNASICLSISVGVAQVEASDDLASLFRRADEALLHSKRGGRNQVRRG